MKHSYRQEQQTRSRMFRCRCRSCEARVTLELRPDNYRRRLACWSCGRTAKNREDVWRIDWFRTSGKESKRRGVCHCLAAPFPHRPGHGLRIGGGRALGVRMTNLPPSSAIFAPRLSSTYQRVDYAGVGLRPNRSRGEADSSSALNTPERGHSPRVPVARGFLRGCA